MSVMERAAGSQALAAGTVTVVTQTQVRSDSFDAFARWQDQTSAAVAAFPGFIQQTVIPPTPPSQVDWVILQRFAGTASAVAATARVPVRVTGESIEALTDGGPFGAVVCSLVLCTVDDADSVVRQLFSRLKPGGELRYMDHVASNGWRGRIQRVADVTVWPRLFGNCHTHRETERTIAAAGFTVGTARRQWAIPRWAPLPSGEFALGRAVKPI